MWTGEDAERLEASWRERSGPAIRALAERLAAESVHLDGQAADRRAARIRDPPHRAQGAARPLAPASMGSAPHGDSPSPLPRRGGDCGRTTKTKAGRRGRRHAGREHRGAASALGTVHGAGRDERHGAEHLLPRRRRVRWEGPDAEAFKADWRTVVDTPIASSATCSRRGRRTSRSRAARSRVRTATMPRTRASGTSSATPSRAAARRPGATTGAASAGGRSPPSSRAA